VSVEPIRWTGDSLELLNQLRLPREVVYVTCRTSHEVAEAIKSMVVRGAPAIGVSAAFGMALAKSIFQVVIGGALVFAAGVLIGSS